MTSTEGLDHLADSAFVQLFYVSSILALAVAAGTKISLCLLIHSINNHGRLNIATKVLFGVIVAWAISGIFAVAFQCSIPRPWAALSLEECPNREAIFLYNGIMDILTDVALCVLPVAMMWKVQTSVHRKLLVTALFGTRIVYDVSSYKLPVLCSLKFSPSVPILSVPGLVSTHHLVSDYSDSTWTAISHVVWLQVTLGLSVLTACVPSLKGVIDSLLGSTAVAAIQAPYQLASSGKGSRLHATNLIGSGSQKRPGSHLASGLGNSRTAETRSLRKPDWPEARRSHEILEKEDAGCSDSIRKLTDSGEFETHSDGRRRSSSQEGSMSMKSSETGYRL